MTAQTLTLGGSVDARRIVDFLERRVQNEMSGIPAAWKLTDDWNPMVEGAEEPPD